MPCLVFQSILCHHLQQMALDQPHLDMLDMSLPEYATGKLTYLSVFASDMQMICDTSTDSPWSLVPTTQRRAVFNTLHSLAHPKVVVIVKLIWPNMRHTPLLGHVPCILSKIRSTSISVHLLEHLALQTLGSAKFILISLDHGWSVRDLTISWPV